MRLFLVTTFATFFLTAGLLAQNPNSAQPRSAKNTADQAKEQISEQALEGYIIGPEDVLSINVWKEAELTTKVSVRPDGKIGVPLLNDIQASGYTPKQLQERLTEGLKMF